MHAYDALSTSELGHNACRCVEATFPNTARTAWMCTDVYVQGYRVVQQLHVLHSTSTTAGTRNDLQHTITDDGAIRCYPDCCCY